MIDAVVLDVYGAACLAGGTDRVVDAAVVALVESGRVRVDDEGLLRVVEPTRRGPVEAAVSDAIGTRGFRSIGLVRLRAAADDRIVRLVTQLENEGLLTSRRRGPLRRGSGPFATAAGRQVLRRLRADPPAWSSTPGTSAVLVALGGPRQLPDAQLRDTLFGTRRPAGRVRTRQGWTRPHPARSGSDLYLYSGYAGGLGIGGVGDMGGGSCGDGGGGGSC